MGKLKNIIGAKISGNVGSMNFRKRGDEVVVAERSYSNSSKASGASEAQRLHRCRLTNIVNFYKVIAEIQARAWESKVGYQSDFNMLTKNNLSASPIFLTKQEAAANASVVAQYLVSKGTLADLKQSYSDGKFDTGIKVGPNFDFANNTIGGFSNGVIYNNDGWKEGDKMSLALLTEAYTTIGGVVVPQVSVKYFEVTLDTNDTTNFATLVNFSDFALECNANGEMFVGGSARGYFGIHSRKVDGQLWTSTQQVVLGETSAIYTKYTSDDQKQLAMDSYGYQADVLLTPSAVNSTDTESIGASVTAVMYGSNALVDGGSIESGDSIKITGTGLNAKNCKVTLGGVVYVPTKNTDTEVDYSISQSGVLKVYINTVLVYTVQVTKSSTEQNITSLTWGTDETTEVPLSNQDLTENLNRALVVKGANLGELTATGGTLSNIGGSATERTATFTVPAAGTAFTISCGTEVIISGTASEDDADGGYQ